MGRLSEEEIKEFQDIYLKPYGEEIDKDDAISRANRLLFFVALAIEYDLETDTFKDEELLDVKKLIRSKEIE